MDKETTKGNDSYNKAFKLSQILNEYKPVFTDEPDEITIYPHAWYKNHFEIMVRDKNKREKSIGLEALVQRILEIIKEEPIGLAKINDFPFTRFQSYLDYMIVSSTPIILKFDMINENGINELITAITKAGMEDV